jgi:hypothetical protein
MTCGDDLCSLTEILGMSCPLDCPPTPICGDGLCAGSFGSEDCSTCPADCGTADGICGAGDLCCPSDCGTPFC